MKSIFLYIIAVYTVFLPAISFASSAKDFHYSKQVNFSKSLISNAVAEIEEIEEDDIQEFECRNFTIKQDTFNNSFFISKQADKYFLKRVLYQNNLLQKPVPLFILNQVFSI